MKILILLILSFLFFLLPSHSLAQRYLIFRQSSGHLLLDVSRSRGGITNRELKEISNAIWDLGKDANIDIVGPISIAQIATRNSHRASGFTTRLVLGSLTSTTKSSNRTELIGDYPVKFVIP